MLKTAATTILVDPDPDSWKYGLRAPLLSSSLYVPRASTEFTEVTEQTVSISHRCDFVGFFPSTS